MSIHHNANSSNLDEPSKAADVVSQSKPTFSSGLLNHKAKVGVSSSIMKQNFQVAATYDTVFNNRDQKDRKNREM